MRPAIYLGIIFGAYHGWIFVVCITIFNVDFQAGSVIAFSRFREIFIALQTIKY